MESRSHDLGAELRMHYLTVECDTFLLVAVAVSVTSVEIEVTGSEAILAPCFSDLLLKCLMKRLEGSALGQMVCNILGGCLFESVLTIWCSCLLEVDRAILSVRNCHVVDD